MNFPMEKKDFDTRIKGTDVIQGKTKTKTDAVIRMGHPKHAKAKHGQRNRMLESDTIQPTRRAFLKAYAAGHIQNSSN